LIIDFSNFEYGTKSAEIAAVPAEFNNWGFAALVAGYFKTLAVVTLAVPVYSFEQAVNKVPNYLGDKTWNWGAGGSVTEIRADGTGKDARGNTLKWTVQNQPDRMYVISWSHGYTDTVTLSSDGKSLSGANQTGYKFSATRAGGSPFPDPSEHFPGNGNNIISEWNWGLGGGVVVISENGTGRDSRGNTVQWTLRNAGTRSYELRWSHGYTDTATLSADGNTLEGVNNNGSRFTATHRGGNSTVRTLDLNGSWTKGLLHIWHEGDQVLITGTWKRDNGVWVSLRAEGILTGRTMNLPVRYSANTNAVGGDLRGTFTVSEDGNTITANYTLDGRTYDNRVYTRDQ
jgi:hypothetical protein